MAEEERAVGEGEGLRGAWREAEHLLPLDEVVRKEVWEGSIPIRVELARQDVSTFEAPMPFYVQAPRMGYFPLVLGQAKAYFQNYVPAVCCNDREMWLEHKGNALKWHLPTGVLFDLHAHGEDLPWHLTLHFSGVETKGLLPYEGDVSLRRHFRQTLKQATSLRYGSCKRVNNLSVAQMEQLWSSLQENKFESFTSVNSELLKLSTPGPSGLTEIKRLPLRIYLPHLPSPIQQPFTPFKDDGHLTTLHDVLLQILPGLFETTRLSFAKTQEEEGEDAGDDQRPTVLVQGISPPLQTPVLWLCQQLAGADTFLYICVIPKSKDQEVFAS
ncbi:hypothetical protein GUITHDRAFT_162213 [Guillardia theta CCMP2712]|uniref:Autophagy protein 5 n=2 Tax=Guillardia theta TaxID=55529 RepID=L1JLG3_GUITC|nr:hypothetical protein GUITHDRAFT_162213 [Guillardia theta CCMP2712]EKX48999.1 hypothetical protein GUITHDRAFT_162213 [Guillardia theta CCMP2712]|eukprot:XP_005835979.1 hypothetical protein GUITHDRAFT_162213 [Guillardia theta CCMP2712]